MFRLSTRIFLNSSRHTLKNATKNVSFMKNVLPATRPNQSFSLPRFPVRNNSSATKFEQPKMIPSDIPELNEYVGEKNQEDKRHGYGKFHWHTKDGLDHYYEGNWKNNVIEGTGTLYLEGRLLYRGEFERNRFHGNGFIYLENGTYEGEKCLSNRKPTPICHFAMFLCVGMDAAASMSFYVFLTSAFETDLSAAQATSSTRCSWTAGCSSTSRGPCTPGTSPLARRMAAGCINTLMGMYTKVCLLTYFSRPLPLV